MKILVTGGAGFLGKYIVKLALDAGHEVSSLSRHIYPELTNMGVDGIKCNLSNQDEVEKCDFSSFDAIIHTAALAGVWGDKKQFYNINYIGTKNLFNRAKECGVKYFIYTSSPSVVFGADDLIGKDETLPYPEKFYTHYAQTKAMAESFILSDDSDILKLAIRPHLIWGPGDPHLIPRVSARAKSGKLKIVGDGNNEVDIIYVENAAKAHIDALEKLAQDSRLNKNAYFIGQERPVNLWHFVNQFLGKQNIMPVEDSISFKVAYRIGFLFEWIYKILGILKPEPPMTRFVALQLAKSHWFKHDKAKKDFGYEPKISIEEGLARTFLRSENYKKIVEETLKKD